MIKPPSLDQSDSVNCSGGIPLPSRRHFLQSAAATAIVAMASRELRAAEPARAISAERDPLLMTTHSSIARSRDVALEVLKPSTADLEHGLELHRRSVVFDAYGFAPRAAIDGAAFDAAVKAGASAAELQDLREEMSMTQAAVSPREREEFLTAIQAAGVTCIFQNAGEEGQNPLTLMKRLARFTYLGDMLRDVLVRAAIPDDIMAAKAAGRHCLYLTGNGVPLPQQWENVREELGFVRLFFQLGIRMMHLTYNRRNMLGDGCAETTNGGISDFGRDAIQEMNRVGMIVDVAHSGWRTSLEAAKASSKPLVASHTSCDALNHHIRAKPDEVIKAICDTGGLVGICCIPPFLGGTGDIGALIQHVDYVVQRFGINHVAIGTDVSHTSQYAAAENARVSTRVRSRPGFASLWPQGALGGTWPRSESLAWTNWPLFTVGLVQKGYSDDDIQKILGGNILRVCRDAMN